MSMTRLAVAQVSFAVATRAGDGEAGALDSLLRDRPLAMMTAPLVALFV